MDRRDSLPQHTRPLRFRLPIPIRWRRLGWLFALVLGSGAAPLLAQSGAPLASSGAALGIPESAPGVLPLPLAETRSDFSSGLSGALRVLIMDPGERLIFEEPAGADFALHQGHRWSRLSPPLADAVMPGVPTTSGGLHFSSAAELRAPEEPGTWLLEGAGGARGIVITRVPATLQKDGRLNGYEIGSYPAAGPELEAFYEPPRGFLEVTPENRELALTEHLRLGQFLTKDQFDVWPKYVALDPALLDKIELVIQELQSMGVRADAVHVMSGFRTPLYNGPGGDGRAALSRHMWGDAADIWIDSDGDGRMDDLNGDGRIDIDDAAVIMRAVERVEARWPELLGGAGIYPDAPHHGPYIHIDVRRRAARW